MKACESRLDKFLLQHESINRKFHSKWCLSITSFKFQSYDYHSSWAPKTLMSYKVLKEEDIKFREELYYERLDYLKEEILSTRRDKSCPNKG